MSPNGNHTGEIGCGGETGFCRTASLCLTDMSGLAYREGPCPTS
jgi:hypothetical protein